jgi:hypothetical protein
MSELHTLPAPDLSRTNGINDTWEEEHRAFLRLLPTLLATDRGQYVAVHKAAVVAAGPDQIDVAKEAYARAGYVPIYVGLVTNDPQVPVRLPSPKVLRASE